MAQVLERPQVLTIRFPQYAERKVLSYSDGSLQLVSDDGGQLKTECFWICTQEWALTNLAFSDVSVRVDSSGRLSIAISAENGYRQGNREAGGLEIKNGEGMRLCGSANAAHGGGGGATLGLELRIGEASFPASLACAICKQEKPNVLPFLCRCDSIDNVTGVPYEYVIVGSSFCATAFVQRVIANNPEVKILLIEKGDLFLLEHRQAPSMSDKVTTDLKELEWQPWTNLTSSSSPPSSITGVKCPMAYFGGRSPFWSGWCVVPSKEDLDGWPETLTQTLRPYFDEAKRLLNVTPAGELMSSQGSRRIYDPEFQKSLESRCGKAATNAQCVSPGSMAMAKDGAKKFSTPLPLIGVINSNVKVLLNCTVEKIIITGNKATQLRCTVVEKDRKKEIHLLLRNAKLILAMSTLPSTLLVLNSFTKEQFSSLSKVGRRLTAHFVSSIYARIPRENLFPGTETQLGAVYIAGKAKAQYHLQLSALATSSDPENDKKLCREFSANSIPPECIDSSPGHVIIACSALGELDHTNPDNWFRLKEGAPAGDNGELQIIPNEQDLKLWGTMDDVMFKIIKSCLSSPNAAVEYWHEKVKEWKTDRPKDIRSKNAVHDASTMWMGGEEDKDAPVGLDYRLRGVDNVYVTGGALWPTGGSWNPVLTIVAMAMHLADMLCRSSVSSKL